MVMAPGPGSGGRYSASVVFCSPARASLMVSVMVNASLAYNGDGRWCRSWFVVSNQMPGDRALPPGIWRLQRGVVRVDPVLAPLHQEELHAIDVPAGSTIIAPLAGAAPGVLGVAADEVGAARFRAAWDAVHVGHIEQQRH